MAQSTASSTLVSAPSIMRHLITEPLNEESQGPVLNSMFDFVGDIVNAAFGGLSSSDLSVADIVQAVQAGVRSIPMDQITRLATNSEEFYSVIGAASGIQATPQPHIIATQAHGAHRRSPSHWYINFPHNMSGHDAEAIQRSRKSMTNFRSWSSKKWWEEVGRRFGVADEAVQRAQQSKQFAQIACEDMVKMSW